MPPPLPLPLTDPTPIFEMFRGSYATELLTVAIMRFKLFEQFGRGPVTFDALRDRLGLADRPMNVLLTAMRAMGLLRSDSTGRLDLTSLAREHLLPGGPFDVSAYVGLAGDSPGVKAMIQRLTSNRPAGGDTGAAFIFRDGIESAMDSEASARHLTLALAGRAKNVAPVLAERASLAGARRIMDVGGGTGIYTFAMLRKYPELQGVIFDRAEVLKVAREMAVEYGVVDRVQFVPGDMFADALPTDCDVVLLSNILHDWDVPECRKLIKRCAAALPAGGRLLIHDVFLNDDLGGPLPVALYSAALFVITEGRAYSSAEYRLWLADAGLSPGELTPTLVHCSVLEGKKKARV